MQPGHLSISNNYSQDAIQQWQSWYTDNNMTIAKTAYQQQSFSIINKVDTSSIKIMTTITFFPPSATRTPQQQQLELECDPAMKMAMAIVTRSSDNNIAIAKWDRGSASNTPSPTWTYDRIKKGKVHAENTERGWTRGWCREGKDARIEREEGLRVDNGLDRGHGDGNSLDRERVDVVVDDRPTRTQTNNRNGHAGNRKTTYHTQYWV